MAERVELNGLWKTFGTVVAVRDCSLRVPAGAFLTLLGPSGSGKTSILRLIAGLDEPSRGKILIDGVTVAGPERGIFVPARRRNVALIFQNYALWPHLTVWENVAFGLRIRKLPEATVGERVRAALERMQLSGLDRRYPHELSGGQQQRVALARSLVVDPALVLMDEPLSNLDARLRMEMRAELIRLHRSSGATIIYVTHDQIEALSLSTQVAVIHEGVIQQIDEPDRLYQRPANLFVAEFVGVPSINFISGIVEGSQDHPVVRKEDLCIPLPSINGCPREVVVGIRPEDLTLWEDSRPGTLACRVHSVLASGPETFVQVRCGVELLTSRVDRRTRPALEQPMWIEIRPEALHVFDRQNGNRVST